MHATWHYVHRSLQREVESKILFLTEARWHQRPTDTSFFHLCSMESTFFPSLVNTSLSHPWLNFGTSCPFFLLLPYPSTAASHCSFNPSTPLCAVNRHITINVICNLWYKLQGVQQHLFGPILSSTAEKCWPHMEFHHRRYVSLNVSGKLAGRPVDFMKNCFSVMMHELKLQGVTFSLKLCNFPVSFCFIITLSFHSFLKNFWKNTSCLRGVIVHPTNFFLNFPKLRLLWLSLLYATTNPLHVLMWVISEKYRLNMSSLKTNVPLQYW